jgi:N-acetylmuramoyl-L-alanine amidase
VLHHTGPGTFKGIVNWLKDPNAKAAAHYVLGTAAELTQLVNTTKKAWHAGPSGWTIDGAWRSDLNNCTIGIEICNIGVLSEKDGKYYYEVGRGDPVEYKGAVTPVKASITYPSGKVLEGYVIPYPEVQIDKLIALCKGLVKKYPDIGKDDILTHFNISTPEGRKNDPFGLDIQSIIDRIFG